jgi:hypothetical protein
MIYGVDISFLNSLLIGSNLRLLERRQSPFQQQLLGSYSSAQKKNNNPVFNVTC